MAKDFKEKRMHQLFVLGLFFKALDGTIELIAGLLLLFITPAASLAIFLHFYTHVAQHQFFANELTRWLSLMTSQAHFFAALYLLTHGLAKVALVAGLLNGKLWVYPLALGIFTLFGIYQVYYYIREPSVWLALLTLIDIAVIALTWNEYRQIRDSAP
jgi:uncharacterized membrane protein